MTLSIQPLDKSGQPKGAATVRTWDDFLAANDGFPVSILQDMLFAFAIGAGFRLGHGMYGEYRLTQVTP